MDVLPPPQAQTAPQEFSYAPVSAAGIPVICFSKHRWDGSGQRSQQLLARLAKRHPVLFVEVTAANIWLSHWRMREVPGQPAVIALELFLPEGRWADRPFLAREISRLVQQFCEVHAGKYHRPILWFNEFLPASAVIGRYDERVIVYDCTDEPSQFGNFPEALATEEPPLLRAADIVFYNDWRMGEKQRGVEASFHFYGAGTDCDHFAPARVEKLAVAPEVAQLAGPVLGYLGVVDQNLDFELLARLADAEPHWSFVMVGPILGINPADLPRRPNLHWVGQKEYRELPAFIKGFSVCLLPLRVERNARRFDSTHLLQCLAAGRPVIATAHHEVETGFSTECCIAADSGEFIALCAAQIASPDLSRVEAGLELAALYSWDLIVDKMERNISAALLRRTYRKRPVKIATEGRTQRRR